MAEEIQSELKLGGEELDRDLRRAAFGDPKDRVHLFKRLVAVDLIVPVEKIPGEVNAGASFPVPLVTNAQGSIGFPLFTSPQRLKVYAGLAGWTSGEEDPPYLGMNAQGAMEMATSTDATVAVIDPGGPVPLIITRDEAETLIQGKIPGFVEGPPKKAEAEPARPAVPSLPLAQETAKVPQAAAPVDPSPQVPEPAAQSRLIPPTVIIPSKVISVFKVLMEQFHQVRLAVFYEQTADKKVFLGFGLRSEDVKPDPIIKSAKDALTRIMKGEAPIEVVALTPELEVEVLQTCKPFFTR